MSFLKRLIWRESTDDDRIFKAFRLVRKIDSISVEEKRRIYSVLYEGLSPEEKEQMEQDCRDLEQETLEEIDELLLVDES